MKTTTILWTVGIAAAVCIAIDFILPLKQNADGSVTRL